MHRNKTMSPLPFLILILLVWCVPTLLPAQDTGMTSATQDDRTYTIQVRQMHRIPGKPAKIVRGMSAKVRMDQDFELNASGENWDWSGSGRLTREDRDIYLELNLTLNEYAETKLEDGTTTRIVENELTQKRIRKIRLSSDLVIGQYKPADQTGKDVPPDMIVAHVRPVVDKSYSATEMRDKMTEYELFTDEESESSQAPQSAKPVNPPKLYKAQIRIEGEVTENIPILAPNREKVETEKKVYRIERTFRDGADDVFDVRDKLMSIQADIVVEAAGNDAVKIDLKAKHRGTTHQKPGELVPPVQTTDEEFEKEMTVKLGEETKIGDLGDYELFMKLEKFELKR